MSPNIPNYYLQRDFQENLEAENSISRIFGVDGFSGRFIRIIIIKIFKSIYKTMEDTPKIKYKNIVKSEIDQLIEICEKEQKVQKN